MPAIKSRHLIIMTIVAAAILSIILYFVLAPKNAPTDKKPHIIIIMVDDLGRNDVGFHGSNQIPTPNIDALAYNGIILDKLYTQYACTPSRAALLTGNYPLRYGMHGLPIRAGENRSLPLDLAILPQHLKKLGYETHLVGKWHLGAQYRTSTPLRRGFDSHFGYWHGFVGYFDYKAIYELSDDNNVEGLDLHDGFRPVWPTQGKYATGLFTEKTLEIIDGHEPEVPLFLFLAHLAPHTGKGGTELGVPNVTLTNLKYSYIEDQRRRLYADVVNLVDESVGQVVKKLGDRNMLDNSVVLFLSDNGAQTVGTYENAGSNWPLRGVKLSDFEGGVRAAAAIFSPLFQKRGYVNKQLIHLTDFLPTLYKMAGGHPRDLGVLDGIDQWETLSENVATKRSEVLLNVNEVGNTSAIITDGGKYKFIQGTFAGGSYDKHYGESGKGPGVPPYDIGAVRDSATNLAIGKITKTYIAEDKILKMRQETDLTWCRKDDVDVSTVGDCTEGCLFDLEKDPCEITNIIHLEADKVAEMRKRLQEFDGVLVPQPELIFDPASNPVFYNNTWCTWLDDAWCFKTPNVGRKM